ncbi:MAG TPA: hypothetical protein VK939_07565 [Longimicrobiales bacterium]|nr:hypothetical protein [Longimicrobiales bacterium]
MLDAAGQALRAQLMELFRSSGAQLGDEEFDALALRIFRFQFERNVPYAAFCERRGLTPDAVAHWSEIPAVPTAAFREVELIAGARANVEMVFRTSGTSAPGETRGSHYILDLSLYHFSLIPAFAAHVLPDGAELPLLSLIPSDRELPDSSLAHMVAVVLQRLGAADSGYFATAERGIDDAALGAALARACEAQRPVCLLGTSFSFVHWTDRLRERGERYLLPQGSRLMDTGGYKGRSREVPAGDMLAAYQDLLGIGADYCVNEYGMTELCSQYYDATLRAQSATAADGATRPRPRRKVALPWLRTRVVDPETLEAVPDGTRGLLQHLDLANLGSVIAVQTEDVGMLNDDGLELFGRAGTAVPRGCSIAMDDLLAAVQRPRA